MKSRLRNLLERLASPPVDPMGRAGIEPGLYHYMIEAEGTYRRLHLRVDSDGQGLLLANATAAARLNPSGVVIAKGLLEGDEPSALRMRLSRSFRGVGLERADADIDRVRQLIADLQSPGDAYPILDVADPRSTAEAAMPEKPLSADIPLATADRLVPLLDRLWDIGIPHVTFIAGEDPEPRALVRVVERAEDLGMIAGVRGRGSDLVKGSLIRDLALAGLDHVDVLYLSKYPQMHDSLAGPEDHHHAIEALAKAQQDEICPVADVVLIRPMLETVEHTLRGFSALGVRNAGLYALAATSDQKSAEALSLEELVQAAKLVEELADELGVRLSWYPPVQFDSNATLAEQVRRGPRCSGDMAVRVEPDGSVIPARGPHRPAGNLLLDDWQTIRDDEVYRKYRQRVENDTHCAVCPGLAICAADCPRDPQGWAAC